MFSNQTEIINLGGCDLHINIIVVPKIAAFIFVDLNVYKARL